MEGRRYDGLYQDVCEKREECLLLEELINGENILPDFFKKCPGGVYERALEIVQERFPDYNFESDSS